MKSRFDLLLKNLISAYLFLLLTALAYFCSRIYTIFTHGETSKSLSMVWVFLLLAGTAFRILTAAIFTLLKRRPRKIASDIYDSGVITYTAGMTARGIFEIFGSDKNLILYYEIAGIGLMAVGFILIVACSQKLSIISPGTTVFDVFAAEKIVERTAAWVNSRELHSLHDEWARENGYYPLSRRRFLAELKRHYEVIRSGIIDDYSVVGVSIRS